MTATLNAITFRLQYNQLTTLTEKEFYTAAVTYDKYSGSNSLGATTSPTEDFTYDISNNSCQNYHIKATNAAGTTDGDVLCLLMGAPQDLTPQAASITTSKLGNTNRITVASLNLPTESGTQQRMLVVDIKLVHEKWTTPQQLI